MRYTLTIPGRPPSWNDFYSQKHWSYRSAIAKGIHAQVAVAYMQAGADAPAFEYPVSLTVTAYFTGRRQDCSNITGKLYEDGLVACGILPDDTPKYVGRYTTVSKKSETGEDYVVIVIDDERKEIHDQQD